MRAHESAPASLVDSHASSRKPPSRPCPDPMTHNSQLTTSDSGLIADIPLGELKLYVSCATIESESGRPWESPSVGKVQATHASRDPPSSPAACAAFRGHRAAGDRVWFRVGLGDVRRPA